MAACRYQSKIGSMARCSLVVCVFLPLLIEGIHAVEDSKNKVQAILKDSKATTESLGPTSEATLVVTNGPSSEATFVETSTGPSKGPTNSEKPTSVRGKNMTLAMSTKTASANQSTTSKPMVGTIIAIIIAVVVFLIICCIIYCFFCGGEKPKEKPQALEGGKLKSKVGTVQSKLPPSGAKSFGNSQAAKSNDVKTLGKSKSGDAGNAMPPNLPVEKPKGSAEAFKSFKTKQSEVSGVTSLVATPNSKGSDLTKVDAGENKFSAPSLTLKTGVKDNN